MIDINIGILLDFHAKALIKQVDTIKLFDSKPNQKELASKNKHERKQKLSIELIRCYREL